MSKASGRDAILASALKLFAERGFDGVRTAEILDAAGQKNQTALQYHFGSREGLYAAIVQEHLLRIDARRLAILNPRGVADPRPGFDTCLRAAIEPLADEVAQGKAGAAYLRFLRQFVARPGFSLQETARRLNLPGMTLMLAATLGHLADLPPQRRQFAVTAIMQMSIAMLVSWRLDNPEPFDRAVFIRAATAALKSLRRSLA